jgi:hypothetical protein
LNAIVGNIPNFPQQIDTSSLDLGDIIGAIIGSIVLVVAAITFFNNATSVATATIVSGKY